MLYLFAQNTYNQRNESTRSMRVLVCDVGVDRLMSGLSDGESSAIIFIQDAEEFSIS